MSSLGIAAAQALPMVVLKPSFNVLIMKPFEHLEVERNGKNTRRIVLDLNLGCCVEEDTK